MNNETRNDRELVLTREVRFPRELVWLAMTVPEHQNQWWGPDGFKNEDVKMDFRVGGSWTYVMLAQDGTRSSAATRASHICQTAFHRGRIA